MPRAVVVTKLDQARADYDGVLREAQAAFGSAGGAKVVPLYVPVSSADGEITGLAGLLSPGAEDTELRGELIEAVIEESEDETLMERYVGGEEIAEDVLVADLERAVARGQLPPRRTRLLGDGRRLHRAARPRRQRLPLPRRAPVPGGLPALRSGRRPDHGRPGRTARGRGGQDDQ